LGTLLWAVVTFYGRLFGLLFLIKDMKLTEFPIVGLFTTAGKPAEWVIPGIVSALGGEMKDDQWYKDFESGYSYETPVLVDAFRLALFLILGFYFNAFVDYIFDQDAFWGWSSGAWFADNFFICMKCILKTYTYTYIAHEVWQSRRYC